VKQEPVRVKDGPSLEDEVTSNNGANRSSVPRLPCSKRDRQESPLLRLPKGKKSGVKIDSKAQSYLTTSLSSQDISYTMRSKGLKTSYHTSSSQETSSANPARRVSTTQSKASPSSSFVISDLGFSDADNEPLVKPRSGRCHDLPLIRHRFAA
jgi:hypothetical protein